MHSLCTLGAWVHLEQTRISKWSSHKYSPRWQEKSFSECWLWNWIKQAFNEPAIFGNAFRRVCPLTSGFAKIGDRVVKASVCTLVLTNIFLGLFLLLFRLFENKYVIDRSQFVEKMRNISHLGIISLEIDLVRITKYLR